MRQNYTFSVPSVAILPNIWDLIALVLISGFLMLFGFLGHHFSQSYYQGQTFPISLQPHALIEYGLLTTTRMFIALLASTIFSMTVATLAAKFKRAEQLIIPLIDILQSVPVLGYLSFTVTGFIVLFPGSILGPECAAIFAVFVSQVWNMTLSFYQSLKTIPTELMEASHMYQLSSWQRFWRLEAPYATPGLLWNAMISMSGGWFFIVAAEAISVNNQQIFLPGIGSYIAMAIADQNMHAIAYAILAMLVIIVLYDQLFFRPLIAWSEKFHLSDLPEEGASSWLLSMLQRTRIIMAIFDSVKAKVSYWFLNHPFWCKRAHHGRQHAMEAIPPNRMKSLVWYSFLALIALTFLAWFGSLLYQRVSLTDVGWVVLDGFYTFLRVSILIVLCSLIWVPIGVWAGLRPNVAKIIQPLAQIFAAFPANLFFPVVVFLIATFHLNIEIWCAPLMILGTQWYILFNVIAGASTIPKELKLAAKNFNLRGWLKWKRFYLPAIFPYFITGAITAAGGAWNASIVAEMVKWGHQVYVAHGLGAYITLNTQTGHFLNVALGVVVMCLWVTLINFFFWRKLYQYAENKYRLNA